jgi:hypothetical protein
MIIIYSTVPIIIIIINVLVISIVQYNQSVQNLYARDMTQPGLNSQRSERGRRCARNNSFSFFIFYSSFFNPNQT